MLYIILSVIITLVELSISFLFVNYLQEIYLFDIYKASGFSVNFSYFVSIVIFVIVYFLFSWTFGEIFGKNINYLANKQVNDFLSKKKENEKYIKVVMDKIKKDYLFKRLLRYSIFFGILLYIFLMSPDTSFFILNASIFSLFFIIYLSGLFKIKQLLEGKEDAYLSKYQRKNIILLVEKSDMYVSEKEKEKAVEFYQDYKFLSRFNLIKLNIENSTKNTTILVFLYFLLGCFFFWITRSMDTVIVIKHEVKLILQIIICFIPIILFATYIGKRRFYMFQYQKLIESKYAQNSSLASIDLSISTRDNRYDILALFEICVFFLSGFFFLFHRELGLFITSIVIVNIIFVLVQDYQAK